MAIRRRGASWQADITAGGKRHRADFKTAREAEVWEARARAAVLAGEAVPPAVDKAPAGITLREVYERTARAVWRGKRAERVLVLNASLVVAALGPDRPAAAITTEDVDRMVEGLYLIRNSAGTINRKLAALSRMLRFAQQRGWIERVPHLERQKEGQGRLRFITREEEARIVDWFRHRGYDTYADLVVFLVETGARLGEALGVRWEHGVNPVEGRLTVTFWNTKGGAPRTVPMTRRALAAWEALRERHGCGAGPFDTVREGGLRSAWERMQADLNLPDVVRHTLRHTCASRLVQAGVDLRRVRDWLGHKSIQVTMRYAHLAPRDLHIAADALDKLAA